MILSFAVVPLVPSVPLVPLVPVVPVVPVVYLPKHNQISCQKAADAFAH